MATIQGRRVVLREKTLQDAQNDYRWRADPELARLDDATPLRMTFSAFLEMYEDELQYPTPGRHRYAVESADGRHIGNCMYYDLDLLRSETELGIMIGEREYWDQGYGAEAIEAVLGHLFQKVRLQRVYLHTLEWNIRAQKCFLKCGFVPTGKVYRNGSVLIAMEILREAWAKQKGTTGAEQEGRDSSGPVPG